MLSTLQPVIVIIKIYDFGASLPDELLADPDNYINPRTGSEYKWYLSEAEKYSLKMQTEKRNMIPFVVVIYPMIFCFLSVAITSLIRKSICIWFETVLYIDDDEEAGRARVSVTENDDPPNHMFEHTINSDEEEDEGDSAQNQKHVKLKTYDFKRPQFLKKLTNTYFKKSKS